MKKVDTTKDIIVQVIQCLGSISLNGGEGGIRTHGTLARSLVFKTGAFDHSTDFTDFV